MRSPRTLPAVLLTALLWLGGGEAQASDAYWHGAYHRANITSHLGAYGAVSGLAMVIGGPLIWGRSDVGAIYVLSGAGALIVSGPVMAMGSVRAGRALDELDVLVDRRAGRRAIGFLTVTLVGGFVPVAGPFLVLGGWIGTYVASTTQITRNVAAHRATFGREAGWMLDDGPVASVMVLPWGDPKARGVRLVARF